MLNEYHFITDWRVRCTPAEAYDLISHPLEYSRWWPAVYLRVEELEPGDESGIGRRVRFHTKGWLPYTLLWESCAVRAERPNLLTIRATGDFDGRGIWHFAGDGDFTNITFDWRLSADKPLLRYLSPALKPAFSANHRWAMKQGEKSLELELARRRARTPEELSQVPPPPQATKSTGLVLATGAAAIVAGVLMYRRRKSP